MSKLEELTERIVNLEILVFILMYRNKPIRVNGVNIAENSYTKDLIKRISGVTVKPAPKQLKLFRGDSA